MKSFVSLDNESTSCEKLCIETKFCTSCLSCNCLRQAYKLVCITRRLYIHIWLVAWKYDIIFHYLKICKAFAQFMMEPWFTTRRVYQQSYGISSNQAEWWSRCQSLNDIKAMTCMTCITWFHYFAWFDVIPFSY
jgi:hypothetical protein